MESLLGTSTLIIITMAIALFIALFRLGSINFELKAIRKLLEAEFQRDARDRWASTHPPAA